MFTFSHTHPTGCIDAMVELFWFYSIGKVPISSWKSKVLPIIRCTFLTWVLVG